uniref:protein FAM220A n=1 Tax=Jaculus jaculus TaxID=51337 RepID=UPI001E1B4940|nr:protein FAM220A [Jaculus jaculus]
MGGRRGTLDTCLANVKCSGGGDLDKLLSGLKKRTQRGSPCPAVPSKKDQPVVGANGKSQDEAVSLEMKSDLSCADHLLHSGDKLHPLTESTGRGPTLAAAVRKDEGLPPGPVEERLARVYGAMKEALRRDWLEGGPRATDSQEGQYPKGELWVSGWPGHPKPWDVTFLKFSWKMRQDVFSLPY